MQIIVRYHDTYSINKSNRLSFPTINKYQVSHFTNHVMEAIAKYFWISFWRYIWVLFQTYKEFAIIQWLIENMSPIGQPIVCPETVRVSIINAQLLFNSIFVSSWFWFKTIYFEKNQVYWYHLTPERYDFSAKW